MKLTLGTLFATCALLATPTHAFAQSQAEQIAAIKAATDKYQDVNAALANGYIPDPSGQCVTAAEAGLPAEWGAMGIHYMNMARLKITTSAPRVDGAGTHTDFMEPAILLYEPQADGSMVLVGVENLVFQDAWAAAGNTEPPSFAGQVWDAMADDADTDGDEAHAFQPHYDLHIWTHRENPAGAMLPFNPTVSCQNHTS